MIGTSDEVLLWLTRDSRYAPLLGMSRQRLVGLRKHLACGELGEQAKESMLMRLCRRMEALSPENCDLPCAVRRVRSGYVLPAIVRDKHGRLYSELSLVRMCRRDIRFAGLHLDHVCGAITRGEYPSHEVVRSLLRAKGWTMTEPRCVLPSVWEVRA